MRDVSPQFQAVTETEVPCVILCNKVDLAGERKISKAACAEIEQQLGYQVFETSAKNGDNVHSAFEYIAHLCFGES